MSDKTVVHLLRHGEVDNPEGIIYGRLPGYHLSATGREMAEAAADYFADRPIVALFASPLERAQETAAPVAGRLGLQIVSDDRLIESTNHFQGLKFGVGDGSLRHPRHWGAMLNPFRPSWGEAFDHVVSRMAAVVERARLAAEGSEAVCVSHQLPIWITRRSAEGKRLWHDPRKRECALGSVTSFSYEGGRLVSISYAVPPRRKATELDTAQ